jgi:hypothetical protein
MSALRASASSWGCPRPWASKFQEGWTPIRSYTAGRSTGCCVDHQPMDTTNFPFAVRFVIAS